MVVIEFTYAGDLRPQSRLHTNTTFFQGKSSYEHAWPSTSFTYSPKDTLNDYVVAACGCS